MAINKVKVDSYTKNLMKSFGYISTDVLSSYAPTIASLARSTKEAASSSYQAIKDFTSTSSSSAFSFNGIKEKGGEIASNIWKNTIDDLKTGKIYNKERNDALDSEMMKSMGLDFDFDFDFDDDWGDGDITEEDSAKAQVVAQVEGSKAIINAVDAMGRGLSASMTAATVESATYIANSAREDNMALFNLNKAGYASINKALMSVNETIYNFSKIGEPLTAHMQNSTLFFSKTEKSLNNIEQSLKQIEKNTKKAEVSRGYTSGKSVSNYFSDEGVDFGGIRDDIKKSIDEYKELIEMLAGFSGAKTVTGGAKNISLAGMAGNGLLQLLIPRAFKDSLKGLDKSLKYGLQAGLTKSSKGGFNNELLNILASMFLPKREDKRTINTRNYQQGPVAWDGVARKALTDVIPTILLETYSAITGAPSMRYDYNSGKFVTTTSILSSFRRDKERYVRESGGELLESVEENIKGSKRSDQEKEKMLKEVYNYFEKAFDSGNYEIFKVSNDIDPDVYEVIKKVLRKKLQSSNRKDRNILNRTVVESAKSSADYANYLRSEEAKGNSIYTSLENGFKTGKLGTRGLIGQDQFGHDYFFYLQGIWQYTNFLASNVGNFGNPYRRLNAAANLRQNGLPTIPVNQTPQGTTIEEETYTKYKTEEEETAEEIANNKKALQTWFEKNVSAKTIKAVNKIFGTKIGTEQLAVVGVMDSISDSINRLMFGNEDDSEKGLMGFMFDKMKDMFDNAKTWFKENIMDRFKNFFKEKILKPMGQSSWAKETKNTFRNMGQGIKGTARRVMIGDNFDTVGDSDIDDFMQNGSGFYNGRAAYGRKVTKSGIVAVSEGELIIPSEYNPFYHGLSNKAVQMARERRLSRGLFGGYATGGTIGGDADFDDLMNAGNTFYSNERRKKRKAKWAKARSKVRNYSVLGVLFNAADNAFSSAKEKIDEMTSNEKLKEDQEKLSEKITKVLGSVGGAKGEIGAGAIIGGAASLFTGGIIGPIAGAALGAGLGFLYKSKEAQDFIFGPEDENGERKRQKAYDFMMKEVPAIGKGAGIGLTAGIFMGSPILGAFLGGAVGFTASNEKFQNYLFGEKDKDGNRTGGILANKIFDHIDITFHNINNRLGVWLRDLGKNIKEKVGNIVDFFKERSKDPNSGFFTKLIGGTLNLGEKIVKAPIKLADKVTGSISNRIMQGNLIGGYSAYNKGFGRNMTAQERMLAKSRLKPGLQKKISKEFNNFDAFLANIKDYNELERYKTIIQQIKTTPTGSFEQEDAINTLLNDKKFKEYMGETSGKFLRKNINKLSGLVDDESKRKGLDKESQVEDRENKKLHLLERISGLVETIITGKPPKEIANTISKDKDQILEDENHKTVWDALGNPHYYIRGEDGNWTEANNDKDTNESKGKIQQLLDSIIEGPKQIAIGIKTALFGDGDPDSDNNGLFGGPLKKAKKFLSNAFNKVIKPVAGIAAVGLGIYGLFKALFGKLDGWFNKLLNKLGAKLFGFGEADETTNDIKTEYVDADGNAVELTENGQYVNSKGEAVDASQVKTVRAGKDTFLSKFRKGNLRQAITKGVTKEGFDASKTLAGKLGQKMVKSNKYTNKLSNYLATNADDIAVKGGKKIHEFFEFIAKHLDTILKHVPIDDATKVALKTKLPSCFKTLGEKILKCGQISKAAWNNFADFVPVLNIAVAVSDFVTGYEDARTTLGITAEPTKPQRLIAGLLRLVKNLIPIVGPFIPDDLIINVFTSTLGGIFKDLNEQRSQAKAEVAQYNAEHGTDYDVGEYNKAVLNDYTFTERIGNVAKTAWNQTKSKFSDAKEAYNQNGIGAALNKLLGIDNIASAYNSAGGGAKGVWEGLIEATNQIPGNDCASKMLRLFQYAFTGDDKFFDPNSSIMDAFQDSKAENGAKSSVFSKIVGGLPLNIIKTTLTPVAMITTGVRKVFTKAKDLINSEGVKADYTALKEYKDKLDQYASDGKFGSIMTESFEATSNLAGAFKFAGVFYQFVNIFKAGIKWITGGFNNLVTSMKDSIANTAIGKALGIKSSSDNNNKNNNDNKKESWWSKTKNFVGSLFGKGSGLRGGASALATNCNAEGFVSQLDDRYRDIKFGNSTVGNNGCGPAVAAMASGQAGGCLDMNTAINKAKPYTNADGTSIDYFKDTLKATEIKGNAVKSSLESGRPVILLGRDPSNKSKEKSPFGPNNHYVLATAMKNGKVLINDPESRMPKIYDSSILSKSNIGLTYGGRSGFGKGTTGVTKSSVADVIWNTLKANGFSDEAAAGILGNAQQESSMSPTADAAAYGLFQFEKNTGSASALENYAKSLGKSKDDPEVQTNYMLSLFKNEIETYSGNGVHTYSNGTQTWWPTKITLDEYKKLTNAQEAAEIFERTYERASIPMRDQRKAYAADFLELYKGTGTTGTTANATDASSTDDSSSSSGGLLETLSTIFGSLTNIFNLNGFSMNSSNSSSSGTSTGSGKVTNAQGAAAAATAAENELGYAETGDNITKFGEWSGCNGQPWCAAFSAWAIAQAFDKQKSSAQKALYGCENINYCPTLVSTFKKNNAWYNEPEVGDEVLYSDDGDDASHVGLVTAVDKNAKTFISVEGNTNNQVTRKQHSSYKDGTVYGFGRPDYTGANATVLSTGNTSGNTISGDADFSATGSGLRGGSSGILRKAAPSRFAYGKFKGQSFRHGGASGLVSKNRFGNMNSDLKNRITTTLTNFRSNLTGSVSTGSSGIDPTLVADLLASITSLLDSIASNTAPTEKIYEALTEYIDYIKGNKGTSARSSEQIEIPKSSEDIDSNLAGLVSTLAAIARG